MRRFSDLADLPDGSSLYLVFRHLEFAAQDLRALPLVQRKAKLRGLLIEIDEDRLRYSEEFDDPIKLLATAEKMGLEGVVSKRGHAPYRSGPQTSARARKLPAAIPLLLRCVMRQRTSSHVGSGYG